MTGPRRSAVWGMVAVVAALLVCTSAAGAALSPTRGMPVQADVPEDEKIEATDSVDVWERAIFPLRTNVTQSGTSVENRDILLRSEELGESNYLKKETLSVFDSDEQIELEFDDTAGADTGKFANEDLDLIVAKLEPEEEAADSINESMGNVGDLVDELTAANANGNATFEELDVSADSDGSVTTTYNPSESGHYVFLLENSSGEGFEVNSEEISVSSQTTIVGIEAAMVQTASADVDAPDRSVHGDDIEFDVNANLGASQTNHSVVVYDEDVFTGEGETQLTLEGELNRNQSTDNLTVEHDIVSVNGVADADGSVTVAGTTVGDDRVSGNISAANIVEFAFDRANQSEPDTDSQDSIVLDASAVAVEGGGDDTTLTVETFENWSTGDYRYIYASQGDGIDDFSTATGTITIADEARSSGGGGGGGGGDDDDDPPEPVEETLNEIGAQATNVEEVTPTIDSDSGTSTATFETSENVETITLQTTDSSTEVTVTDLDPDTQTTNPAPGQTVSLQDITVSESDGDSSDTSATVRFRISNERLQERGTTAENLRAFRLVDGSWQGLETSVAEETANGVVLEAQTPGFSVFAVSAVTPPEASLSLNPATAQTGEDVTLSGVDSSDEDGEIVSYEWNVDGETYSGETVTISLDDPGDYTVELTVTDDSGETDTVTETLSITQAETATPTPDPDTATSEPGTEPPTTSDPLIPGFGFTTAILALLAAALIAIRRHSDDG